MLKLVAFAILATAAHCGVIAPAATSHSSLISHSAPVGYSSPLGYSTPVSYTAPRLAAPLAVAHAPLAVAHAPVAIAKQVVAEPYAPPHYDFNYAVHDPHTGDVHEQQESRVNDVVQGSYSLVEPDGSRRIVHYSADDHNGFQAVVQREPATHPVQVAPVVRAVAPVVRHVAPVARLAAPAYASYASPALVNHVTHY